MNRKLKLEELGRDTVATFKKKEKHKVIVILDNVRSLNNIGSFFRTCDAYNIESLYLVGITATPPHREIRKTAIGASESVDWKYFATISDAIHAAKNKQYKVFSIEQAEQTISLEDLKVPAEGICLIFGNEVDGVQDAAIALSDAVIEIPQFGTKHSLNVSVCAGSVLWEVTRQIISR